MEGQAAGGEGFPAASPAAVDRWTRNVDNRRGIQCDCTEGGEFVPVLVQRIVDEAIRFERNLASLYLQFFEAFPEDGELWWELSVSEAGHASLLESSQKLFRDEFAHEMVDADLDGLRRSNEDLESMIRRLGQEPVDRVEAFRAAIGFEGDQNERTLLSLLKIESSDPAKDLVGSIQHDDSVHERKIRDYAAGAGIAIDLG